LRRPVEPEQYTSWAFGRRLRAAGLLGSMGSVGDAYDNSVAESFYNPWRRHSSIGDLAPAEFERRWRARTESRDAA